MILHLVKRLLFILLGYGLAAIASGIVVGLVYAYANSSMAKEIFGIVLLAIVFIGMFAALPALLTVIAAEVIRIRGAFYYVIAATLIGMALPIVMGIHYWYIAVGFALGPVAGLIYWATAGRGAGYATT